MYNIDKSEALESLIEENLFGEQFMVDLFGTTPEYEFDSDTKMDTDMSRDPYLKRQILVNINGVDKDSITKIEADPNYFEKMIKSWAKKYEADYYYSTFYTDMPGNNVMIVFDEPVQDDAWQVEKYMAAKGKHLEDIKIGDMVKSTDGSMGKVEGFWGDKFAQVVINDNTEMILKKDLTKMGAGNNDIKIGDSVSFDEYKSYSGLDSNRGLPKKVKVYGQVVGLGDYQGWLKVKISLDEDERMKLGLEKIETKKIEDLTKDVSYADGGELTSSELDMLNEGFKIKQLKDFLNQKFPDSFGFKVFYPKGRAAELIPDYDRKEPGNNSYGLNGIQDENLKLMFPTSRRSARSRSRGLIYRLYQGGENTYFDFVIIDKDYNEFIGTFGFKDEGDVDKEYITRFVAFLHEAYGYPFSVKHIVAKDGTSIAQKNKIAEVMHEFKEGKLKDRSGKVITNRKQAIAIALSVSRKYNDGGRIISEIVPIATEEIDAMSDAQIADYLGIDTAEVNNEYRLDAIFKKAQEIMSMSEPLAADGFFGFGKSQYNTGRSWHLDRARYNKSEKWEKPRAADGKKIDKRSSWHADRRQYNKNEKWEKPLSKRKQVKIKVSLYKFGEFLQDEEIDLMDLPIRQLNAYELSGFDIRDKDKDKYFYASDFYIDTDAEGTAVKYAYATKTKYAAHGKDIGDGYNDKFMAISNCDTIYEYAVKLDKMVGENTELEEWVKMKMTRVEQNVAGVKHALEAISKYDDGGEIFKKQLLHIAKYAVEIKNLINGGTELMSWMEAKLAISAECIDGIYHHLDYEMGNRAKNVGMPSPHRLDKDEPGQYAEDGMEIVDDGFGLLYSRGGKNYLVTADTEDQIELIEMAIMDFRDGLISQEDLENTMQSYMETDEEVDLYDIGYSNRGGIVTKNGKPYIYDDFYGGLIELKSSEPIRIDSSEIEFAKGGGVGKITLNDLVREISEEHKNEDWGDFEKNFDSYLKRKYNISYQKYQSMSKKEQDKYYKEYIDDTMKGSFSGNPIKFARGGGVKKRSLMSMANLVDWKGEGIKKWYIRSYPTDELGEELNDDVTFKDLMDALNNKQDVYKIMGVADSVVRERLFEYLSLVYDVDYDVVYKKWLDSDDYANGGGVGEYSVWEIPTSGNPIKLYTGSKMGAKKFANKYNATMPKDGRGLETYESKVSIQDIMKYHKMDSYSATSQQYTKGGGVGSLQEIEYLIDKIKKAKYEWYELENDEDKKMFDLFEKYSGLTGVDDLYGLLAFKFSGIKGIKDLDTAKEYVSENGAYDVFDFKEAVKFIEEVISLSKQNPSNSIPRQIQKEMENATSGKTLPPDAKYVFVADAWDGWLGSTIPSMKTFKDWSSASRSYKKFLEDSNFNQGEWQMGLYKCEAGNKCKIYVEDNVQKVRGAKKVHEFDYMEALVDSVSIVGEDKFKIKFEKDEYSNGGGLDNLEIPNISVKSPEKIEKDSWDIVKNKMYKKIMYKVQIVGGDGTLYFDTEKDAKDWYNKIKNFKNMSELYDVYFEQVDNMVKKENPSHKGYKQAPYKSYEIGNVMPFSAFQKIKPKTHLVFTYKNAGVDRKVDFIFDKVALDKAIGWLKIGNEWMYGDYIYDYDGNACIGSGANRLTLEKIVAKSGMNLTSGSFKEDSSGNYIDSHGYELINQFDGTYQVLDSSGMDIAGEYETLEQGMQTIEEHKMKTQKKK